MVTYDTFRLHVVVLWTIITLTLRCLSATKIDPGWEELLTQMYEYIIPLGTSASVDLCLEDCELLCLYGCPGLFRSVVCDSWSPRYDAGMRAESTLRLERLSSCLAILSFVVCLPGCPVLSIESCFVLDSCVSFTYVRNKHYYFSASQFELTRSFSPDSFFTSRKTKRDRILRCCATWCAKG